MQYKFYCPHCGEIFPTPYPCPYDNYTTKEIPGEFLFLANNWNTLPTDTKLENRKKFYNEVLYKEPQFDEREFAKHLTRDESPILSNTSYYRPKPQIAKSNTGISIDNIIIFIIIAFVVIGCLVFMIASPEVFFANLIVFLFCYAIGWFIGKLR